MSDRHAPGEKNLIDLLIEGSKLSPSVIVGPGDDCALIETGRGEDLLVTTDMMIEGVHFERAWFEAEDLGHKLLVRSLSDIAACGGTPLYYTLSIGIPVDGCSDFIKGFSRSLRRLEGRFSLSLTGGDVCATEERLFLDLQMLGRVEKGRFLSRAGASPGESIFLTGDIGGALLGLRILRETDDQRIHASRLAKLTRPEPRVDFGKELSRERIPGAVIDVSDGLSTDLGHLCRASQVGAIIEEESLPLSDHLLDPPLPLGEDPSSFAAASGEEYELLFTAPGGSRATLDRIAAETDTPVTIIGEVVEAAEGLRIRAKNGSTRRIEETGWDHFRGVE